MIIPHWVSGLAVLSLAVVTDGQSAAIATRPTSGPSTASTSSPAPASSPATVDRQLRIMLLNEVRGTAITPSEVFDLVDSDTREILRSGEAPREQVITFTDHEIVFESLKWRTTCPTVDVVPVGDRPIRVKLIDDWREYHGGIRLIRRPEGGAIVNLLDIEEYLVGVVSSELPGNFHKVTFQAQAIAARTYAWFLKDTYGRKRDWDLTATEKSQVYRGLDRVLPKAADAVRDTRGLVCTWRSPQGEKIFCTYFSSRCGGTTAPAFNLGKDAPIPPLAGGVACAYCRKSDAYRWPQDVILPKDIIGQRLAGRYQRFASLGLVDRVEVSEAMPDGRALRVTVVDVDGESADLDAENFRLTVDPTGRLLQSTYLNFTIEPDDIIFAAERGLGHGMGLCQYGSEYMAKVGRSATAILRHYYPRSHVTRAY